MCNVLFHKGKREYINRLRKDMVNNMNMNILVADTNSFKIYDFLHEGETTEQLLARAIEANKEDIASWERNCQQYPDMDLFRTYLEQTRNARYEVLTWKEYTRRKKIHLLHKEPKEITKKNLKKFSIFFRL